MLSLYASAALALATVASAQQLQINTPASMTQCQPTQFTWSGGKAPYYVSILPGRSLANPYETVPTTSETSYTWVVDIGAGTEITLGIKDANGEVNYSGVSVIGTSSNDTCIGMNAVWQASIALTASSTAPANTGSAAPTKTQSVLSSAASDASTKIASASAVASSSTSNTSGALPSSVVGSTIGSLLGVAGLAVYLL